MKKTFTALVATLCFSSIVHAQEASPTAGRMGIGVESSLGNGLGGPAVVSLSYDTGTLQIDGLASYQFRDQGTTTLNLGARAYYLLHKKERADLAAGGGFGIMFEDPELANTKFGVAIEAGARVRIFLVENAAFLFHLGLGTQFIPDATAFVLGGGVVGGAGFLYYF